MIRRGSGQVDGFEWLQLDGAVLSFAHIVSGLCEDNHLLISCFDSGPIYPSDEEQSIGWRSLPAGMLSPPLHAGLTLPSEQYDEWWVFELAQQAEALPAYDCFVNRTAWTLRTLEEIESAYDPTWERGRLEWLGVMQERFWSMVRSYRPVAYIADGDSLIVASNSRRLLEAFQRHDV
ncbi:hypothetical protein ACEN8I_11700 [Polaromonas sp. CT11-55]|uniref:hypothetical protein n=1 Tax=Polaromonas sp. CT11-55 TaxID=3243045 RepID=UPI0039A47E2B